MRIYEKESFHLEGGGGVRTSCTLPLDPPLVPRATVSFVFPRVLMFPETKSRETSGSRENKTN